MGEHSRKAEIIYLTEGDIIAIHNDIIYNDEDAEPGVMKRGSIDFVLTYIEEGFHGEVPEGIHEKAVQLFRLLSANHIFADGNKRTALNATWTFYFLNGYYFKYGEEIKAILKLFAVMERMVDTTEVTGYFEEIAAPILTSPEVNRETKQFYEFTMQSYELVAELTYQIENLESPQDVIEAGEIARSLITVFSKMHLLIEGEDIDEIPVDIEPFHEHAIAAANIVDELQLRIDEFD